MPWAQLWQGRKNCLKKIKISDLHFLQSLFCAPYNRLLHSCVDTAPLSKALRGACCACTTTHCDKTVVLWHNTTLIVTEQEHSLGISTIPRPFHAKEYMFHFKRNCRLKLQCVVWYFARFATWSANTMYKLWQLLFEKRFYLNKSWWCLLCRRNIYSVRS